MALVLSSYFKMFVFAMMVGITPLNIVRFVNISCLTSKSASSTPDMMFVLNL